MQKGLRESDTLAAGARKIMTLNPLLRKETEAYSYALEYVAKQIVDNDSFDWQEAAKLKLPAENAPHHPATRTISISDDNWNCIEVSYQSYVGQSKLMFSKVLSICIAWTISQLQLKRVETGYRMIARKNRSVEKAMDYSIVLKKDEDKTIEEFKQLDLDSKLTEIYRLLLEIKDGRDS